MFPLNIIGSGYTCLNKRPVFKQCSLSVSLRAFEILNDEFVAACRLRKQSILCKQTII